MHDYRVTTDLAEMDDVAIHAYLTRSYWAKGITLDIVRRSMSFSLCFGLLHKNIQVGFARAVTDYTTFAYLADVYVLEEHQGNGLGKRLVAAVLNHSDLQGLRRMLLATADAHGLYRQFGFSSLANPQNLMERHSPAVYSRAQ